jgi:putative DNA primase/helicase
LDDFLVNAVKADPQSTPENVLAMLIADATPFLDTITKSGVDTHAVETELEKVLLSDLYREQLCKEFAFGLGVKIDLLRAIGKSDRTKNNLILSPDPPPWPASVDGEDLLHEIAALIKRHIILDSNDLTTVTLWIVLTYLADVVDVLAILGIVSPEKRCGKTRLLTILSRLVYQALPCSNISAPSLYRVIEKFSPTLLVDEADSFLQDNEQLRGVIDSGHTRGAAFVVRTNPNTMEPERFSTWSPKAIALIGKLPATIHDCSLLVSTERRKRGEKVLPLRKTPLADYEQLCRKILRWVEDNKVAVAGLEPRLPSILNDRASDNWFPLLAIAQTAGQTWYDFAIRAIQKTSADNSEQSVVELLLVCLRKLYADQNAHFLATTDILTALNSLTEMPWADWRNGKGLSAEKLRKMLADFKARSVQVQVQGQRARGCRWKDLHPVFLRYLSLLLLCRRVPLFNLCTRAHCPLNKS